MLVLVFLITLWSLQQQMRYKFEVFQNIIPSILLSPLCIEISFSTSVLKHSEDLLFPQRTKFYILKWYAHTILILTIIFQITSVTDPAVCIDWMWCILLILDMCKLQGLFIKFELENLKGWDHLKDLDIRKDNVTKAAKYGKAKVKWSC